MEKITVRTRRADLKRISKEEETEIQKLFSELLDRRGVSPIARYYKSITLTLEFNAARGKKMEWDMIDFVTESTSVTK